MSDYPPTIYALLPLLAPLPGLSRAAYDARYPEGYYPRRRLTPWGDPVTRRDWNAIRRTTRAVTKARAAVRDYLLRTWPEYGRKVDHGWWAGPAHVDPCRDPLLAVVVGGATHYGAGVGTRSGESFSRSGYRGLSEALHDVPVGGFVIARNPDAPGWSAPMLTYENMAGACRYASDVQWSDGHDVRTADVPALARIIGELAARWTTEGAAVPGGMAYVGFAWFASWHVAHGGSVGIRAAVDRVEWFAGVKAGTSEATEPPTFYPDCEQPPYPPVLR